jgi:hypothetical protein
MTGERLERRLRRCGRIVVSLLVGVAGCEARSPVAAPNAPVQAAASAAGPVASAAGNAGSPPLLAYLQETGGNFELRLFNPTDGANERLELRPERPQVIVWRTDRPEVVTLSPVGVYAIRYRPRPGAPESVGDPAPAGVKPRDGWIGADGKALRIVAFAPAANAAPECGLYDVPATGAWRRLADPAPEGAGKDETCSAFAQRHRPAAGSISSAALLKRQPCAASGSVCSTLGDARFATARAAVLKATQGLDAVAFAQAQPEAGAATPPSYYLAIGVATGDTPHLLAPAWLARRESGALVTPPLKSAGPQLQAAVAGPYVLLAAEYSGADPVVVDLGSGKTVLETNGGSAAVWVPAVSGR